MRFTTAGQPGCDFPDTDCWVDRQDNAQTHRRELELPEGLHQVVVEATDWYGNSSESQYRAAEADR
ncbi:hypothetical protein [Methylomonas sp. MgM2]